MAFYNTSINFLQTCIIIHGTKNILKNYEIRFFYHLYVFLCSLRSMLQSELIQHVVGSNILWNFIRHSQNFSKIHRVFKK